LDIEDRIHDKSFIVSEMDVDKQTLVIINGNKSLAEKADELISSVAFSAKDLFR
jgi:hypothetical protein